MSRAMHCSWFRTGRDISVFWQLCLGVGPCIILCSWIWIGRVCFFVFLEFCLGACIVAGFEMVVVLQGECVCVCVFLFLINKPW